MTKHQNSLSAEHVFQWLQKHPTFLLEHPELLRSLELPSEHAASAGATSLATFQARRAQTELSKLRQQLNQLTAVADQNEKLMHRLHAMILILMSTASLRDFFLALFSRLKEEFDAPVVGVHLNDIPDDLDGLEGVIRSSQSQFDFLDSGTGMIKPQCGRFTQAKLKLFFPNKANSVRSAAAIPLLDRGLLVVGSEDQSKFQPQMGTLFLELLAATITHRLSLADQASAKGPVR